MFMRQLLSVIRRFPQRKQWGLGGCCPTRDSALPFPLCAPHPSRALTLGDGTPDPQVARPVYRWHLTGEHAGHSRPPPARRGAQMRVEDFIALSVEGVGRE